MKVRIAAAALALLSGACATTPPSATEPKLAVVAGFYPLYEIAARVGGDLVAVTNLTPPGAEPHDLEPTTRDLDALLNADLILYLGSGFQPSLETVAKQRAGASLDLLAGEETADPHVWLDPLRMREMIDVVRDRLSELEPDATDEFASRATAYAGEMSALDGEFTVALRDCDTRVIVTAHAAFGYLADRYDLRQEPIAGVSPGSEPNPKRLAELADLVRDHGVTTIFTESLVSPRVAETLAREAGVTTATLDPVEGLSEEAVREGGTYASVMRENLSVLTSALGCE
ncbi:MAG TPA: metal ABC transporter substrate-binding protein [Actinomycetota bacterium]